MDKTRHRLLGLAVVGLLILSYTAQQVIAWPCPPCPDCYTCTPTGCEPDCGVGQTCCGGSCCSSGDCCNNQICCSGQKCCTDSGAYCCPSGYTCCQRNCCDEGETCCNGTCCPAGTTCCGGDIANSDCWKDEDCGCDPVIGGCSEKKQVQPGDPAYGCWGDGSGCCIDLGEVLCYEWKECEDAGYHALEICYTLDPYIPEGYCTAAPWPYCQDCKATGDWNPYYVRSKVCSFP